MSRTDDVDPVECPACGLEVPPQRTEDMRTPAGPVTVCKGCHPSPSPDTSCVVVECDGSREISNFCAEHYRTMVVGDD